MVGEILTFGPMAGVLGLRFRVKVKKHPPFARGGAMLGRKDPIFYA